MSVTLHGTPVSGPCRMVSMTLELVGKTYDYKYVDLLKGGQHEPEYLKVLYYSIFDIEHKCLNNKTGPLNSYCQRTML